MLAWRSDAQPPPPLPPEATPKPVRDLIRSAAEALSNKDATGFLDHFDSKMPGYQMLDFYIQAIAARDSVVSTVEIVMDKGDEPQRMLELDWILVIDSDRSRRAIVKVAVERQGKKWKFTSLDPIDFFMPPP